MCDQKLNHFKQEKDLGLIITNNHKMSDQCTAARKKANLMLGLISRNFSHKSAEVMKRLKHLCGHI